MLEVFKEGDNYGILSRRIHFKAVYGNLGLRILPL